MRRLLLLLLVLTIPLRLGGCASGLKVTQGPLVDCRTAVEACK